MIPDQPMMMEEPPIGEAVAEEAQAREHIQEILGSNQSDFADRMLEDNSIPIDVLKEFSVFGHKEFALTNISSNEQIELLRLFFEDTVNDYILYTPHYQQTAKMFREIDQLRVKNLIKIYRSTGGDKRERAMYQSFFQTTERKQPSLQSPGFWGKVKGAMF